jgi:hypothetical protein
MEQINALVDCDVARLNVPLRTFYARVGHNFVARFRRVPADVTRLFVRVFRANGAYFDVSANGLATGEWVARIPATCLGDVGSFKYEVHATAYDDEPCAIGVGRLVVGPFSTTTNPDKPGVIQKVAELPCEGGGYVQVVMKWDGFAWVQEAVYNASTNEGGAE